MPPEGPNARERRSGRCVCGCGSRFDQHHHVIYAQELRRRAPKKVNDRRNLVPIARSCHEGHHSRQSPLATWKLPDSVFSFGLEVMDAGELYEYLIRRYAGADPRLDALLTEWEAANAA